MRRDLDHLPIFGGDLAFGGAGSHLAESIVHRFVPGTQVTRLDCRRKV